MINNNGRIREVIINVNLFINQIIIKMKSQYDCENISLLQCKLLKSVNILRKWLEINKILLKIK